jgi:hypothetical protein
MIEPIYIVGIAGVLGWAAYAAFRGRVRSRAGIPSPILPASELQKRYGLYAANRPTIRLDAQKVPAPLRDLIPLAETWGIGDDIIRFDFEQKASEPAKAALVAHLQGRIEEVQDWLGRQPDGDMSEEAAAFMYMLSAWDEVRPLDGTES